MSNDLKHGDEVLIKWGTGFYLSQAYEKDGNFYAVVTDEIFCLFIDGRAKSLSEEGAATRVWRKADAYPEEIVKKFRKN